MEIRRMTSQHSPSLPAGQAYSRRRPLPQEVRVRCRPPLRGRPLFTPLRAGRSLADPNNQRRRDHPLLRPPSNNSQSRRRKAHPHKRQHQSSHNRLNNNNKKSHKNKAHLKGSNNSSKDSHPELLLARKESPKLPVILSSQRANSLRKRSKCTLEPRSANSRCLRDRDCHLTLRWKLPTRVILSLNTKSLNKLKMRSKLTSKSLLKSTA